MKDTLDWEALTGEQRRRWNTVLSHLTAMIPPGTASVIVNGVDGRAVLFADPLSLAAQRTGWHIVTYDDASHRFLAVATRR